MKVSYDRDASLTNTEFRRRIGFWLHSRPHDLVPLSDIPDVVILNSRSKLLFNSTFFQEFPVVFDLVDSYFLPDSIHMDIFRGLLRSNSWRKSITLSPFSKSVIRAISLSSRVVCASSEQADIICHWSKNVTVIPDSHEEFPLRPFTRPKSSDTLNIFWEGQPYSLDGLIEVLVPLMKVQNQIPVKLFILTDEHYFQFGKQFVSRRTSEKIRKIFGESLIQIELVPWTIENVISYSAKCHLGLIPVSSGKYLANLKPENRILIYARLGLPVLVSNIPSHRRIEQIVGLDIVCEDSYEWVEKIKRLVINDSCAGEVVLKLQSYLIKQHNFPLLLSKWDRVFQV